MPIHKDSSQRTWDDKNPMRIFFLASYFPRPTIPLAGVWALEQAKALAKVSRLAVVCCTPWVPGMLSLITKARPWIRVPRVHQWDNVKVEYVKTLYYPIAPFNRWAFPDPSYQMSLAWFSVRSELLRKVRSFRPDIIYCHHTAVNGYYASQIANETGIPYAITDHDFDEIARCEHYPGRRAFFASILRNAAQHLCVSHRMERDVRRLFPSVRTATLHNGINPPSEIDNRRPAFLDGKLIIFAAGMFTERKGFPLLIEAFAQLAPRFPNSVLRIAGDGEQRAVIEATIRKHQVSERVTLLGRVPHEHVMREAAWCDIFALTSWNEPFGVVYVEAMAAGRPIVACTDSGIADVVEDGIQGYLVPPKDVSATALALERLLRSASERENMGQNAKALARDLTWESNTEKLLGMLKQRLSGYVSC